MQLSFKNYLLESSSDKGILKAIFVIGIPGSGKSYTTAQLNGVVSPKIVNTDKASEFMSAKIDKKINSETWDDFKDSAHRITKTMLMNYLDGVLPLFIDGTSSNLKNIHRRIGILKSVGYDIGIINVTTSLETAKKRAKEREEKIGRAVDVSFIEANFKKSAENAAELKSQVSFFREINNDSGVLDDAAMKKLFNEVQDFYSKKVSNLTGRRVLEEMNSKKTKYLAPEIMSRKELELLCNGWYRE